jgi:hypothetical protein
MFIFRNIKLFVPMFKNLCVRVRMIKNRYEAVCKVKARYGFDIRTPPPHQTAISKPFFRSL